MEFNPQNKIVQRCLQGMEFETQNNPSKALSCFTQAWNEAENNFEKFLAAFYIARNQTTINEQLTWLEKAVQAALNVQNVATTSALPSLYENMAICYEQLNDLANAQKHNALASKATQNLNDEGPFYHGTKADLSIGDSLIPGNTSNYQPKIMMNHIYFTANINGAGLAAALANGDGREHIYRVEPQGNYENDPNVTNKKFPGNPTRSYRSTSPLIIVGEVEEWTKISPEERQKWKEKLAKNQGEIIN